MFTNDNRPFAYYDPRTHRIRIMNNPQYSARLLGSIPNSAVTSPLISFNGIEYESDSGLSQTMRLSSLFQGNVDIMMSGVFGGPPGQRYQNGQFIPSIADLYGGHIGNPEAFFAQAVTEGESQDFSTESDFDMAMVDVSDFIDMDSDLDEEDVANALLAADSDCNEQSDENTSDAEPETPLSKKSNCTTTGDSHDLLAHLDGLSSVTSFKNNQDRCQVVAKLPHDPMLNATPLKTGKTADTAMTTPRKRKRT